LKVVLDANVFIAALLKSGGTAFQAMDIALREYKVVVPEQFIKDLYSFLQQARKKGVKISPEDFLKEIAHLQEKGTIRIVKTHGRLFVSPHEADNRYIEAAVEHHASVILSGDADLNAREVKEKVAHDHGIAILPPHEFLEWHRKRRAPC
jgi:putative PIN family toxin of toxin-antitoxin system